MLQFLLVELLMGFDLRAGDHLQARETSSGPIVSSTLHLPPRKVPISASCAGLAVGGLRGAGSGPRLLFSLCGI